MSKRGVYTAIEGIQGADGKKLKKKKKYCMILAGKYVGDDYR